MSDRSVRYAALIRLGCGLAFFAFIGGIIGGWLWLGFNHPSVFWASLIGVIGVLALPMAYLIGSMFVEMFERGDV